jgi:cyclin-dependent kinase 8/11
VCVQGIEDKSSPNPFQLDQLDKIFKVLGNPNADKWPTLTTLPHWQSNRQQIQSRKYENPGLYSIVQLPPKTPGFDLLSRMLEYDPIKRITAAQALDHEYFRNDPVPGRNSLVPANAGDKVTLTATFFLFLLNVLCLQKVVCLSLHCRSSM